RKSSRPRSALHPLTVGAREGGGNSVGVAAPSRPIVVICRPSDGSIACPRLGQQRRSQDVMAAVIGNPATPSRCVRPPLHPSRRDEGRNRAAGRSQRGELLATVMEQGGGPPLVGPSVGR